MNKNQKLIFTKNEIEKNIDFLFENLWPEMNGREIARVACYKNIEAIVARFNMHTTNFDLLLSSLSALDGLGLVISSGLIFIAYPNFAVPFDKYTMSYSIREGILQSNKISNNKYSEACSKVLEYIDNHMAINSILEFVRTAGRASIETELLISPE